MRLTTFSDYSLRVLIYLAADPDRRATIAEIARAFDVSENHLMKVAHFLGKGGWLNNVRGKGGGLELAKSPEKINVGDVIRAAESNVVVECFDRATNRCTIAPVCRLKGALAEAAAAFYKVLDGYTLADITDNRKALARIMLAVR
ncbi:MAG: RrF2 family transcriptional regulator [Gemmatimonadota bacterium]